MYCGCPTFGGIVTEYDSHLYRLSASTGDVRRSVDSVDRKFGEKSLYLVPHWALLMYRSPGYLAGQVWRPASAQTEASTHRGSRQHAERLMLRDIEKPRVERWN